MDSASFWVFISSFAYNFVKKSARITIFGMWVTSRWIIDRLKYFKSELNTQGRREDRMMLRRWAIRELFISGAYLRMYLSDCLQFLHTAPPGDLVVPFRVYDLSPTFGSVLRPILTHSVSGADLENYWVDYSHIAHTAVNNAYHSIFSVF